MKQPRPLNILLVEGDDRHARDVALLLGDDGHAVSRAGTLAEAGELCEDGRFDLLIAANRLPDGPACELLAETGPCVAVPGILLSSPGDDLCHVSRAFRGRLTRPVAAQDLRRAVARALLR